MEFLAEGLERLGMSGEAIENGLKNLGEEATERIKLLTTRESGLNFGTNMGERGAIDGPSITATAERGANITVQNNIQILVINNAEREGLSTALAKVASEPLLPEGIKALNKLSTTVLEQADEIAKLKTALLKPPSGLVTEFFTGVKNNWGALLVSGVTIAVVTVWLANGGSLSDLIDAVGNVLDDTGKNLIGAIAGVATSLTEPIGKGLGGALKTVGVSVAIAAGVALLVVGIYYGVRKTRENTTGKSKIT
jgi:hypothetical protein